MSDRVPPPPDPPGELPSAELQVGGVTLDRLADVYSMDVRLQGLFVPTREELPVGAIVTLRLRTGDADPDIAPVRLLTRVAEAVGPAGPAGPGLRLELLELRQSDMDSLQSDYGESLHPTPTAHVLVVDDEPLAREETALLMREAGYRVSTARNGVEALSTVLGDGEIDLILTDLNMPTMDGWQLLRLVRSRAKIRHIPVVFLTRLTSDSERLKGYELGVSDYLEKPVKVERLQQAVIKQLARVGERRSSAPPVLRGDLSQVALGSLLSLLELERRTGRLQIDSRGDRATLWLREGAVVRVDMLGSSELAPGLPRLMQVLDWERGEFALSSEAPEGEPEMTMSTTGVLLEHARRKDEARR